ncbi:VWA domain-containing protein [Actinocorallia populi]|uniref:VWA domain-containing protein n=1 Tax=Actinocorallia populi TaxID=2079200 RepID=UPI000D08F9D5|nr:VWA domain-containing protein [Actinocorallia populi]
MPSIFPFSAVVGSDDMALALTLTAVSPSVGGVLVRGEKGTAKSTMVRALARILPPVEVIAGDRFSSDPRERDPLSPDGPFPPDAPVETRPARLVELPVGATEDRVLGSLHLERALTEGVTAYEPGLLARAHRGVLYVDEVNLLHDHLVDLLLDAAATGRATVERDGVSVEHAARFVLVGTMNPEEGELRPQLLDRFGLTVEVAAPRDPRTRVEVVRRRLAFEADPEAFAARFAPAERELTRRIAEARELLPKVELGDAALFKIAEVCAAFEVDGMRADLVTARAAAAHAAWHGRAAVTREDVRAAARLALPHRRRRNPFDAPGLDEELLDRILGSDELPPEPPAPPTGPQDGPPGDAKPSDGAPEDAPEPQDEARGDESRAGGSPNGGDTGADAPEETPSSDGGAGADASEEAPGTDGGAPAGTSAGVVAPDAPYRPKTFRVAGTGAGEAGRRSPAFTRTGRRVGARRPDGPGGALHLLETLRAAAPHQRARGRSGTPLLLRAEDVRLAVVQGRESNLILFCVDASGSMAARRRMAQVKTAILSLLLDAYRRRDKVGLVTFRRSRAEVVLPPTSSVDIAATLLKDLPAGGRTPLAEGLLAAAEVLRVERLRDPRRRPLLVVVTDGRATHGPDAVARSRRAAALLAGADVTTLVVDCETGRFRLGLARELSAALRAEHLPLGEVAADALTATVRQRVA